MGLTINGMGTSDQSMWGLKKAMADEARSLAGRTVESLVSRVKELHSLYQTFGVDYQSMSAHTRRHLGINANTTDNQVRQVVYAKFMLAAVIEWAPSNHYYSIKAFLDAEGPVYKTDMPNELCPYWESFFDDLHEAAASLEKIAQEPHLGQDAGVLDHINSLVSIAEVKAGWCHSLLMTVHGASTIRGQKSPTSEVEIYRIWNQFCLTIGNGSTVPDAALKFTEKGNTLQKYPLPEPLLGATQTRIWFPFDSGAQPWLTHAQAILQQPHHLAPLRFYQGMYADEAHTWMLDKTADFFTIHHRCHIFSVCCSRLHVHCATHSPCRNWGPAVCPHVRAGAERCEDKECRVVDWMKYNVCIPYTGQARVVKETKQILNCGMIGGEQRLIGV